MTNTDNDKLESLEEVSIKPKVEKNRIDYPVIKVLLPKEAAVRVSNAVQCLKARNSEIKADEILSDYLNAITDEYLERQIEQRTPEEFYFEAVKQFPELRQKFIKQAKKALLRPQAGLVDLESRKTRKHTKKSTSEISQLEVSEPIFSD